MQSIHEWLAGKTSNVDLSNDDGDVSASELDEWGRQLRHDEDTDRGLLLNERITNPSAVVDTHSEDPRWRNEGLFREREREVRNLVQQGIDVEIASLVAPMTTSTSLAQQNAARRFLADVMRHGTPVPAQMRRALTLLDTHKVPVDARLSNAAAPSYADVKAELDVRGGAAGTSQWTGPKSA
jgi:hypothetical protein